MQVTDAPWRPFFCSGLRFTGTGSYTPVASDNGYTLIAGNSGITGGTITLPSASTVHDGFTIAVWNVNTGTSSTDIFAPGGQRIVLPGGGTTSASIQCPPGCGIILIATTSLPGTAYTGWFCVAWMGLASIEPQAAHTILGNNTGASAQPVAMTGTQTTALLDAVVGDSGSGGTKGLVPAPSAGSAAAGKYLSAAGTFSVPGPRVFALTDAATIATDASLADVFTVTLGGDRTLGAPTNPTNGQKAVWRVKQDGGAPRALAYNAVFRFGTDVTSPTLSTTAGVTDYIGAIYNGTDSKWDVVAVVKGYA